MYRTILHFEKITEIMVQFFYYLAFTELCNIKKNIQKYVRTYYKKKIFILQTKTILKLLKYGYFACMYLMKYVADDSRSESNMYLATVRFNVEILKRVTVAETHFCAIKYILIIN